MEKKRLRRRWARVSIVLVISGAGCILLGLLLGRAAYPWKWTGGADHPGKCPAGCGVDRKVYFPALPILRKRGCDAPLESRKALLLPVLR